MNELHCADYGAILGYFVLVAGLGFWTARRVKNMADFVMPRKFGKTLMLFFGFGAGTHSDQAVSVAAKSYTNGVSGIWYQWLWLFCTRVSRDEHVEAPCTLPVGANVPKPRKILPLKSFEIYVPSSKMVAGFLCGCAVVAPLIGVFVWLVR